MELRCEANRKFAELDPAALALSFKCKTCSAREGRDVFHPYPLATLLQAIAAGAEVVLPGGTDYPEHDTPAAVRKEPRT